MAAATAEATVLTTSVEVVMFLRTALLLPHLLLNSLLMTVVESRKESVQRHLQVVCRQCQSLARGLARSPKAEDVKTLLVRQPVAVDMDLREAETANRLRALVLFGK